MNSEFEMNQCQPWETSGFEDEQCERFELLSAYIDGEVTPQERKIVQDWLDTDPEFKQVYLGLIRLQTALPNIPIPLSIPTDELSKQVFERIEKEHRWQRLWLWGSLTAAAVVMAVGSSIFVTPLQPASQQASLDSESQVIAEDSLMIAINEPMFDVLDQKMPKQTHSPQP